MLHHWARTCALHALVPVHRNWSQECANEWSYLNKDGEEDDGDNGSKEHLSHWEVVTLQKEAQREGDGTAEATVRHNELIFGGQFDDAEFVDDEGQANNTWKVMKKWGWICF